MKHVLMVVVLLFSSAFAVSAQDSLLVTPGELALRYSDGWANSVKVGSTILVPEEGVMSIWQEEANGEYSYYGDWSQTVWDVTGFIVVGNDGYLAGGDVGFTHLDLSDPLNPVADYQLPEGGYDIWIEDFRYSNGKLLARGYSYLNDRMFVYDLENPAEPTLECTFEFDAYTGATFEYVNGVVFVGADVIYEDENIFNRFFCYDISNPENPHLATEIDVPVSGEIDKYDVSSATNGNYIYVSGRAWEPQSSWLWTLDFSTPDNPVETSFLEDLSTAEYRLGNLMVKGDYLLASGSLTIDDPAVHTFTIFSLENPAQPEVAAYSDSFAGDEFADWGDQLCAWIQYLGGGVFDLSNLPEINQVGEVPSGGQLYYSISDGEDVVILDSEFGVWYLDIDQVSNSIGRRLLTLTLDAPYGMHRFGDNLFLFMRGGWIDYGAILSFDVVNGVFPEYHELDLNHTSDLLFDGQWAYGVDEDSIRVVQLNTDGTMQVTYSSPFDGFENKLLLLEDELISFDREEWNIFSRVEEGSLADPLTLDFELERFNTVMSVDSVAFLFGYMSNTVQVVDYSNPIFPSHLAPIELPLPEGQVQNYLRVQGDIVSFDAYNMDWDYIEGKVLIQMDHDGTLGAWSYFDRDSSFTMMPLSEDQLLVSRTGYDLAFADLDRLPTSTVHESAVPNAFAIGEAYPNPFNATTMIPFELQKAGQVEVVVYDVMGRKVTTLVNRSLTAGSHRVEWNGLSESGMTVASGTYFIRMKANGVSAMRKITLLK